MRKDSISFLGRSGDSRGENARKGGRKVGSAGMATGARGPSEDVMERGNVEAVGDSEGLRRRRTKVDMGVTAWKVGSFAQASLPRLEDLPLRGVRMGPAVRGEREGNGEVDVA